MKKIKYLKIFLIKLTKNRVNHQFPEKDMNSIFQERM